ncbi:MAG TPA: 30S ribosomal protein S6 [Candidatus Cloacimonadota bacterium]|jgi:small subunit ribosomal protein S6|nr:30S ribosomal protein S6 [Candidatus Cloacimonadota bacterium]HOF59859.1 30S ribosomal protein S6 [Candidatus Cloacimonadota bacterium]HQL13950.1 30S ribosomal protein S6 [Candidatus Cloacimonadota bacterium]HQO44584.1 30S ribosomal protein S6 [Candidatus Cloacimonadota bacterium]HQP18417.1 30S ribosomal protein S6 [Candidatus Cloacimonadota bacterium]
MTKNYELMVILSPKLNEEEANQLNDSILAIVKDLSGELIKTEPWGRRMLAYPINKLQEGYYYLNFLKMESLKVKTLKQQLGLNENIIRHMIIARGE